MLIIGLGNPGSKYEGTRHNLGFTVLEEYLKKLTSPEVIWEENKKFQAEVINLGPNMTLFRPLTFMNLSGQAVSSYAKYYKISPEEIVLVHDDLDLPLGKIKIRQGGSAAGHHGVESIISALGSDKFTRIRLGIGPSLGSSQNPKGERKVSFDAERFVIEPFMASEKAKVKHMVKEVVEALQVIVDKGIEVAQNTFN